MAKDPLPSVSRRQQIADRIREQIIDGEFVAGTQLKQDTLCERYDVSPAPVREALRLLENEGLVEHFPNRGVFVCDVTSADLIGVLLPVRLAIETYALETAVANDREGLADSLVPHVDRMRLRARAGEAKEMNEADVGFHRQIVLAADSIHALQLWNTIQPRVRVHIHRFSRWHDPLVVVREHEEMIEAIRDTLPNARQMLAELILERPVQLLEDGVPTNSRSDDDTVA